MWLLSWAAVLSVAGSSVAWGGEEEELPGRLARVEHRVHEHFLDALDCLDDENSAARGDLERLELNLWVELDIEGFVTRVEHRSGTFGSPAADACMVERMTGAAVVANVPDEFRAFPLRLEPGLEPRPATRLRTLPLQHPDRLDLCHLAATSREPDRFGLVQVQASVPSEGGHADLVVTHDGVGDPILE